MFRKPSLLILLVLTSVLFISFQGCSKDDNPVTPGTGNGLEVNGSLSPVSRTEIKGTMFATDANGNAVPNISSSNVTATLNWASDNAAGTVQGTVTLLSNSQSGSNISAGMTMDYSGSMGSDQIVCMENAVKSYINLMGANNYGEIIKFDDQVITAQSYTNNKPLLTAAVDSSYNLGGSTALHQSIYQACNNAVAFNTGNPIKTIIAFTDGLENSSSVSRDEMISYALNNALPVYTVGLLQDSTSTESLDLQNIADTTGGFYFRVHPDSCASLTNLYGLINSQVNNSYSLNITWPSSGLPPAGTIVNAVITVTFNNTTSTFTKSYVIP